MAGKKDDPVSPSEGRKRVEQFVTAFTGCEEAVRELTAALVGDKDSLAEYLDDGIESVKECNENMATLTEEIHGFRKDLRQLARSRGLGDIFDVLRGIG